MDKNLPEMCFTLIESNPPGKFIGAIKRGESGYFATTYDVEDLEKARALVEHLNTNKLGVTPAEVEAMQIGSMMGWDVPGAQLSAHKVPMAKSIPDAEIIPLIAEKVAQKDSSQIESLEAIVKHQSLVIKDLQLSLGTALEQARGVEVTREQFMEFFRGDKFNTDLSPDDKREIFLNSLAGQDDLDVPLLEQVCNNYDTTLQYVIASHEQSRLASLMQAHEIVGIKGGFEARFQSDREYTGRILGVTDLHVIQNIGRTANIYDKGQLDSIPCVGEEVKIVLKNGFGQVSPAKHIETEVSR